MPKKDRSFNASDLIRLARNNLTNQELADVLLDLCLGVKIEDFGQGPVLVPITSGEEDIEEQDIVKLAFDLLSARVTNRLPGLLLEATDIAVSSRVLTGLIQQAIE